MSRLVKFCSAVIDQNNEVICTCACGAKRIGKPKYDGKPIEKVIFATLNQGLEPDCTCEDKDDYDEYRLDDASMESVCRTFRERKASGYIPPKEVGNGPKLPLDDGGVLPEGLNTYTIHKRLTKLENVFEQFRKVFSDD